MRSIHPQRWWARRSTLFAAALIVATASAGVLIAFAQAAAMDPPTMTPAAAAAIDVTWLPVAPIGANTTTYTLSYDTTNPFTATQTITTTDISHVIPGIDGVTYYATVQADDGSGVLSDPSAVAQATADGRQPVSTFAVLPTSPNGAHGWYTSATATISIEETNSGLQSLTVNGTDVSGNVVFGLPPDPSTYPVALAQGANSFSFFGTDVAGNVETPLKTATVNFDSVAPTSSLSVSASGPTSHTITATITASDATPGSGVDHIEYVFLPRGTTPSGVTAWLSIGAPVGNPAVPQGRLTLFARSVDVAGNVSTVQQADVFFDTTAPATTLVTDPASPTGPSGSWLTAPGIALQVADADPNTTTLYSWNDATTIATVGNAPIVPTGAGTQTLRYFSVDSAGNREATHIATFLVVNQQQYTITPSTGAHGAISPPAAQTVAGGSSVTFTMVPDSGYHVADVRVDDVSVGAVTSYDFTAVAADHTISVTFSALPTFTIVPTAGLHGTISPSTTQTVTSGFDSTFTIDPASGYHVADVLVDGTSVGAVNSYTFHNVVAGHTISATFAITGPAPRVHTSLSLKLGATSLRLGKYVTMSSVLRPAVPGAIVRYQVRFPGKRTYTILSSTRPVSAAGASSLRYKLTKRGTYYFMARYLGSPAFDHSDSSVVRVVVK